MRVVEAATRLFDLMSEADAEFPRHLGAGIGDSDMQALQAFHRVQLPAEVQAFYRNFSLPVYYQQLDRQANFFDGFGLFSLQLALLRKFTLHKTTGEFYQSYERQSGWLPFLENRADYFLLDTAFGNLHDASCPLLFLPHGGDPVLRFCSLTAFFDTVHDWLAGSVLHIEDGQLSPCNLALPGKLAEVALRHNPGLAYWQQMAAGAGAGKSGLILPTDAGADVFSDNTSAKFGMS